MSKPIPYDYRLKIISDRKKGMTHASIAAKRGVSVRSVKSLWKRYTDHGTDGLKTHYSGCGRKRFYTQEIKDLVNAERKGFGAPSLKNALEEKYPDKKFPHERQIQLWWQQQGTNRPKKREAKVSPPPVGSGSPPYLAD